MTFINHTFRAAMGMAIAGVLGGAARVSATPTINSGLAYTQDFNTLASSGTGTANPWFDNSTLDGWYLKASGGEWSNNASNFYTAGNGSGTTRGEFYSFGAMSSSERALGSLPRSGNTVSGQDLLTGLAVQYNGSAAVTQMRVTYTAEWWRDDRNSNRTLTLSYQIVNSAPTTTAEWTGGTWNSISTYTTSGANGTDAANMDGSANLSVLVNTSFTVNPGQFILLRWSNPDLTGTDQGIAIDDIYVAVPEGGTLGAGLLLAGMVAGGYRRYRAGSR